MSAIRKRKTIPTKMDPRAKLVDNEEVANEESDGDEEEVHFDSRRFMKHEKSDILHFIYNKEDGTSKLVGDIRDDSDDDWTPLNNDNQPLLTESDRKVTFSKNSEKIKIDSKVNGLNVKVITEKEESPFLIMVQVFIPFLIAGFGTVGAGIVLDVVQHWEVFQKVSEVFILVPALLGLKGNLEMTLASRLSTQANLGNMDTFQEQWQMASGNIALIQCQAAIVGFLAAVFAIIMDWLPEGEFNLNHALLLCASSLLTASFASLILGIIMIIVVIMSHKARINPDNIATPIAASLGDLTTLVLLSEISRLLYKNIDSSVWLYPSLILVFLLLIPLWCFISANNKYTEDVLYTGWTPVISAMGISSIGGCILDFAVSRYKGIAVFQPVINGVGGNLVAVQSSRLSTYLHQREKLGTLPKADNKICLSPISAFFNDSIHSKTAKILLLMVIPGHLIFTYGIRILKAGHTSHTPTFLIVYLSAALLQVILLLYFAHVMIFWMWKNKIDPDNSAIPYLTAIGDLLGTGFLALAFIFLHYIIGNNDSDMGI